MEITSKMGEQPQGPPPEAPNGKETKPDVNKRRESLLVEADKAIELIKSKLLSISSGEFSDKKARELESKYEKRNSFGSYGSLGGLFDYAETQELRRMERGFETAKTPDKKEALYYELIESIKNRQKDLIVGMDLVDRGLKATKDGFSQRLMIVTSMMGGQSEGSENDLRMLIRFIKEKLEA